MVHHSIKCEAIKVNTESGVCPGIAKTHKGETHIFGARTPESKGICTSAFSAAFPMAHSMLFTDKMDWEKNDFFDITCPHGVVTFRMSRTKKS